MELKYNDKTGNFEAKSTLRNNNHMRTDAGNNRKCHDKWNKIYSTVHKRFRNGCWLITFPLGMWLGCALNFDVVKYRSSFDPLSSLDVIVSFLFFVLLFGGLIGFGLAGFFEYFTKAYWVKKGTTRIIEEKYPLLQSYHDQQMEKIEKDNKLSYTILNCMYVVWPIMIFVCKEIYENLGVVDNVLAIEIIFIVIFSILSSYIVSGIIVCFWRVIN